MGGLGADLKRHDAIHSSLQMLLLRKKVLSLEVLTEHAQLTVESQLLDRGAFSAYNLLCVTQPALQGTSSTRRPCCCLPRVNMIGPLPNAAPFEQNIEMSQLK